MGAGGGGLVEFVPGGRIASKLFERLTERLDSALKNMTGRGKIREADVDEAMREVRRALLEADVNFKVAREFSAAVRERAVGEVVLASVTPANQVVKIVQDELTDLLGGDTVELATADAGPTVIMVVGLQGSGKTTSAAKLALHVKKQGGRPLLAAADVKRPGGGGAASRPGRTDRSARSSRESEIVAGAHRPERGGQGQAGESHRGDRGHGRAHADR